MHQPDYRGSDGHDYQLPWVYLHGLKDYSDMAAHLEAQPGGRAVVNFAPTLLDRLSDYAEQIKGWLERGRKIRDPLLAALAGPGLPLDSRSRRELLEACLRANEKHLVNRFPPLRRLVDLARWTQTHPGGGARARWHIRRGLESFQRYFGFRPAGCWPAKTPVPVPVTATLQGHGRKTTRVSVPGIRPRQW